MPDNTSLRQFRSADPIGYAQLMRVALTGRRDFFRLSGAGAFLVSRATAQSRLVISVRVLLDQGVNKGTGLSGSDVLKFKAYQERADSDFATSGIAFELKFADGAYLRQQGYSEIPSRFMDPRSINLFVTESLGYDIDRERTGGCSIGPLSPRRGFAGDPFYKTFIGLKQAGALTLEHEYAHHLTLDTKSKPTGTGNVWADLRNDYWLWRQRHGVAIPEFRNCAGAVWARAG